MCVCVLLIVSMEFIVNIEYMLVFFIMNFNAAVNDISKNLTISKKV